jgi:hypothetical protein
MYQPYADESYFYDQYDDEDIDDDKLSTYLKEASRNIDVLTFNRIVQKGFENLTEHQKEIIKDVCCQHASFLCKNEDMIKTYLSSYSINGVNMSFGDSWNLHVESGVVIEKSLYEVLCSTGLCCTSFYYG